MLGCPFYGFRWPDHCSTLQHVGGNECGLDLDHNGSCDMELEHRAVDYFACPVADTARNYLHPARHLIHFDGSECRTLEEWENRRRKS